MAMKRGAALTELPEKLHPEQRLTAEQGMKLTGDGRTQFYANVGAGIYPQGERYGPRYVRWRAGDLLDAIARRAAAARAAAESAAAAAGPDPNQAGVLGERPRRRGRFAATAADDQQARG